MQRTRVSDPRIVFWDNVEGVWSEEGVESMFTSLQDGEVNTFNVTGETNHFTAFGVAMNVNEAVRDYYYVMNMHTCIISY